MNVPWDTAAQNENPELQSLSVYFLELLFLSVFGHVMGFFLIIFGGRWFLKMFRKNQKWALSSEKLRAPGIK